MKTLLLHKAGGTAPLAGIVGAIPGGIVGAILGGTVEQVPVVATREVSTVATTDPSNEYPVAALPPQQSLNWNHKPNKPTMICFEKADGTSSNYKKPTEAVLEETMWMSWGRIPATRSDA